MSEDPPRSESAVPPSSRPEAVPYFGIAASAGVAVGRALLVDTRRPTVPRRLVKADDRAAELERFDLAVKAASESIRELSVTVRASTVRAEASILDAYGLMVQDPMLRDLVVARIEQHGHCAEWALDDAISTLAAQLRASGDSYLSERSHDFEFVAERILRELVGRPRSLNLILMAEPSIIVAHDLSPAETAGLSKDRVKAIVTAVGSRTNHTAILARALDIPAVVGVRDLLGNLASGDQLIVDGTRGVVLLEPSQAQVDEARLRSVRQQANARSLRAPDERRALGGLTACGTPIELRANIELPGEVSGVVGAGAQGIGLYRTEFLFLDKETPSEEAQYEVYRQVVEALNPLPVTLRTFDIGADKASAAFPGVLSEANPALGVRAIRLGFTHPDVLMAQLRAMVRASAHGTVAIMVPMISTVGELRAVRRMLQLAIQQVDAAGQVRAENIPLGAMIEVPAAALRAQHIAAEAAFLSIGTNDLVQYTLAVDRGNHQLAYLGSPLHPAVLHLIQLTVTAGRQFSRPVSVCGAMASDPMSSLLLVGMGVRHLSMEAQALGLTRACLRRIPLSELEALVAPTLECEAAEDVEKLLQDRLGDRLVDLLDWDG